MSENKIKALEEKGEKLESKIDSNREQINANLEAICWMRKLVLKLNKQKIFFWQLKKEISELEKRYESHSHPQVEMRIEKLEEKYKELFKTVHGIYPDKVDTYEEIMRKHLKSHIVVAREQLTDKDKLTIFREFDEAIQKQLEKLEGKTKDAPKPTEHEDIVWSEEDAFNEKPSKSFSIICERCVYEYIKDDFCYKHHEQYNLGHKIITCDDFEPKEPTDDLEHEHQYDFNYDCIECGKNLLEIIERGFLTTEFDSHNTHKIVQKTTLEGWKSKVQNYTSDNNIDSYNRLFSIIQEIDQYLGESEEK